MRPPVAPLSGERSLGSFYQWHVGLVSGSGILVGITVSMGLDTLSLGTMGVLLNWMGMAAGEELEDDSESAKASSRNSSRAPASAATSAVAPRARYSDSGGGQSYPVGRLGTSFL